ncbi:MAG: hypothetical protein HFG29_10650 [Eubacterium sp.]|nr:hypothetical protein [Eubacterium sp.]
MFHHIIFCKVFNEQTKQYGMIRRAVEETVRYLPALSIEELKEIEAEIMQTA